MVKFDWKSILKSGSFWFSALAVFLVLAGIGFTFWQWDWLHGSEPGTPASTILRNTGLLIGGVIALAFAVWRGLVAERQTAVSQRQAETALRQAETAQQGLLNERYQKGAEMLGSEVLSVRLGGIYALQQLAEEHPEQYHLQIMWLFCAFARKPPGSEKRMVYQYAENEPTRRLREDVQAIVSAIGGRSKAGIGLEEAEENFQLDLRDADFHGASLNGASLKGANLSGAVLIRAELGRSDLREADLSKSDLGFANFNLAILMDAKLSGADMLGANLSRIVIQHTDFSLADLQGVNLSGTFFIQNVHIGLSERNVSESFATWLTQAQLDQARSDPNNPPKLNGVLDAETGEPLIWRGKPIDADP